MTETTPGTPEPPASEAMDILTAAGLSLERAAHYALMAEMAGKDPVAWARHFVKLRQVAARHKRG